MPIINQIVKGGGSPLPQYYREYELSNAGELKPSTTATIMNFANVKILSVLGLLACAYENNGTISVVDMKDVERIGGSNNVCYKMFSNSSITSINLESLASIFSNLSCSNMFYGSLLSSVNVKSLKYIGATSVAANSTASSMFASCNNLTEMFFPAITNNSFGNKTALQSTFAAIPNITIHFPSNTQATVEALNNYSTTAPFGATSGTVLFDLPSTAHLVGSNSVEYERNPKYDTATALSWRVKDTGSYENFNIDWTPYYTSGTTDPAVSDTIYSDSACTTAVTTISSIA